MVEDGPTRVVHCEERPYDVYIGMRVTGSDHEAVGLGNPFMIGRDGTREECIAKYREWAYERADSDRGFADLVASLRGKVLGCWCKSAADPKPCHGDVLAEMAHDPTI